LAFEYRIGHIFLLAIHGPPEPRHVPRCTPMPLTSRGTVSFPTYTEADARVLDTVDRGQVGTASWALCGVAWHRRTPVLLRRRQEVSP